MRDHLLETPAVIAIGVLRTAGGPREFLQADVRPYAVRRRFAKTLSMRYKNFVSAPTVSLNSLGANKSELILLEFQAWRKPLNGLVQPDILAPP